MDLLNAALEYAATGNPVFPCYPLDVEQNDGYMRYAKTPLTAHGFADATTDIDQITRWWKRWPEAAIGLPTGHLWDVLDVDLKPRLNVNGYVALGLLDRSEMVWERAVRAVATPSGGLHVYFPADPERPMGNATFGQHGIDLRGLGGYVLAPPSILYSDPQTVLGHYTWVRRRSDAEGAPLNHARIHALLRPQRSSRASQTGTVHSSDLPRWLRHQTEPGRRNEALFWAANRMLDQGGDPDRLTKSAELIGLPTGEIMRTIRSARNQVRPKSTL